MEDAPGIIVDGEQYPFARFFATHRVPRPLDDGSGGRRSVRELWWEDLRWEDWHREFPDTDEGWRRQNQIWEKFDTQLWSLRDALHKRIGIVNTTN